MVDITQTLGLLQHYLCKKIDQTTMTSADKFSINYFDDAVIGSSPLMMIKAIQLAKSGRRVILIDRNKKK